MTLDFLHIIDEKTDMLIDTADEIWSHPELAFTEHHSARLLIRRLREEGFAVEENLAGIPTAFSGRFGSGSPVIGILGEFDALAGLTQQGGITEKCPRPEDPNTNGHGCGHNLLGVASLGAAIALKHYLETTGTSGTVIYYGCPGEEGGSGKAFMARDGVFDELDAALSWHPDDVTKVRIKGSLANCQAMYRFDGTAAHAGRAHLGRSALDAVELMDIGVNYMREHMISEARIHYAITDAGGVSPNVVQSHAEVLYLIRAPYSAQVKELYERVNKIAEGAALMTETRTSHEFIKACSNTILNDTLQTVLYEQAKQIDLPKITEEDLRFAQDLTLSALTDYPSADPDHPLHYELEPYIKNSYEAAVGSTDVGDVSWICPTAQFAISTWAYGTPAHSWQAVSQNNQPYAHKMTIYAAKAIAAGGAALFADPSIIDKAKEELCRRIGPDGYECPIPKGIRPQAMDSLRH